MRDSAVVPQAYRPLSRRESVVVCAAASLAALVLAWHVLALIVYNLPNNPISLSVSGPVDRYVEPYFAQAWNFFAPNPVDRDVEALYRVRYRDAHGAVTALQWVSLNGSLNEMVRYDWLSRAMVVRGSVWASLDDFANNRFGDRPKRPDGTVSLDGQPYDLVALERTAMAMARVQIAGCANCSFDVQIATVARRYPRFTHRYEAADPAHEPQVTYLFPWVRGENVAPFAALE